MIDRGARSLLVLLLASGTAPGLGCEVTPEDEPTEAGTTDGGPASCVPGASAACVCPSGDAGAQVCAPDGTFEPCVCDDSMGSTDDGVASTGSGVAETGEPQECSTDEDCAELTTDCSSAECLDDVCVVSDVAYGEPCGDDAAGECDLPDVCDGAGSCVENVPGPGTPCTSCPAGPGLCGCSAGACVDCPSFAATNTFASEASISGWELTGDWGLYLRAPESRHASVPFGKYRLGTDGNRFAPYPGDQTEDSTATTPTVVLPASLTFMSWHVDRGEDRDIKTIELLPSDGPVVVIADCSMMETTLADFPFCEERLEIRAADDTDFISIPILPPLVGTQARVRFGLEANHSPSPLDQGWYIDELNVATPCACSGDDECSFLQSACGGGTCSSDAECVMDPVAAGSACGNTMVDNSCNAPDTCNAGGYCEENIADNGSVCVDCVGGVGECDGCHEALCFDCPSVPELQTFFTSQETSFLPAGWEIEALNEPEPSGWGLHADIPRSSDASGGDFGGWNALGNDGNRIPPYTATPDSHQEHSSITTPLDVMPNPLTFTSWHRDEGLDADLKLIEISVDDGATWASLVDCTIDDEAFCQPYVEPRHHSEFDEISLDTSPWEGEVARLRFTYWSIDDCCDFEQGWYIDNLNFGQSCPP